MYDEGNLFKGMINGFLISIFLWISVFGWMKMLFSWS